MFQNIVNMIFFTDHWTWNFLYLFAQSAGSVEYIDCISAEGCPEYDTKQSDVEAPVMLELWRMCSTLLLPSILSSL